MSTVKRQVLELEYDHHFHLIGVVSLLQSYRLGWEINKKMNQHLERSDDLEIHLRQRAMTVFFPIFEYNTEDGLSYILLGNKSGGSFLLPEFKQLDYLFMIKGAIEMIEPTDVVGELRKLKSVSMAFIIDHDQIKTKQNLIL